MQSNASKRFQEEMERLRLQELSQGNNVGSLRVYHPLSRSSVLTLRARGNGSTAEHILSAMLLAVRSSCGLFELAVLLNLNPPTALVAV